MGHPAMQSPMSQKRDMGHPAKMGHPDGWGIVDWKWRAWCWLGGYWRFGSGIFHGPGRG